MAERMKLMMGVSSVPPVCLNHLQAIQSCLHRVCLALKQQMHQPPSSDKPTLNTWPTRALATACKCQAGQVCSQLQQPLMVRWAAQTLLWMLQSALPTVKKRKRKEEETTSFGVKLTRSQLYYRAAQAPTVKPCGAHMQTCS